MQNCSSVSDYTSCYCPICDSLIKVYSDDRIVFTGDPAFCSCRLSVEDKKTYRIGDN